MSSRFLNCCRPFDGKKCSKELRNLTESTIDKLKATGYAPMSTLNTNLRICTSCRLNVDKRAICISSVEQSAGSSKTTATEELPDVSTTTEELPEVLSAESLATVPSAKSVSTNQSEDECIQKVNIERFNEGIAGIKVTPIKWSKMDYVYYPEKKYREINEAVRRNLFKLGPDDVENTDYDEVIINMKERFSNAATTRKEKLLILSMLPSSWSIQDAIDEFKTNRNTVKEAKQLKNNCLSTKNTRSSTALTDETKEIVVQYFEDDEVSRAMPGQKDYVSVKKDGKRQAIQKRLMMTTLKEAYTRFKEIHDNIKIGFSSFASLRPRQCKLLSNSGTHNVCVCTTHENINLILHSLKRINLTKDIKMLTGSLLCENTTSNCYLRSCSDCPDSSSLENTLFAEFEEKYIDQLSFEQWVTTDRCDIETIVKPVDEFVSYFCLKLESLIPHDFIKTEQSSFLKNTKNTLQNGEFLVICDFSENYSFVLQDEVQSHHWNVQQATIHPFVIYFNGSTQIEHLSFIIISEDLRHDSVSVNLFIEKMINFLRVDKHKEVKKIYFMSDGAASQYKNRKNFSSLCQFKSMYGIDAEWHFFATSHGKGPCDAIGGTIKRMATRASLAKEREHPIKTAKELFDWANRRKEKDLTKLSFCFTTTEEYEIKASELSEQFNNAKTIQGTQKFHCFIPLSENKIKAKLYSNCADNNSKVFDILKNLNKTK